MSTTETLPERELRYQCPDCGDVEVKILQACTSCEIPPPAVETITCRCDACYSAKLDKALPGARQRYERWLEREAAKEAKRKARRQEAGEQ